MDVACVGKIVHHDCLPDGRFNICCLDASASASIAKMASGKLYRIAEATVLEDERPEPPRSRVAAS